MKLREVLPTVAVSDNVNITIKVGNDYDSYYVKYSYGYGELPENKAKTVFSMLKKMPEKYLEREVTFIVPFDSNTIEISCY